MKPIANFLLIAFATIACGCAEDYSGDGKLVDNGIFAATDRYVLDLGPIDFRAPGTKTFRLRNLPSKDFVVGVDVRASAAGFAVLEKHPVQAIISVVLMDAGGKPAFSAGGDLASWTWSIPSTGERAFVYAEKPVPSRFKPQANSSYELKVDVLKPASGNLQYEATLIAKSGGWK